MFGRTIRAEPSRRPPPVDDPLRYLGVLDGFVDELDGVLQPMADAGYARNANPVPNRYPSIVHGTHPMDLLDPAIGDGINGTFSTIRSMVPAIGRHHHIS